MSFSVLLSFCRADFMGSVVFLVVFFFNRVNFRWTRSFCRTLQRWLGLSRGKLNCGVWTVFLLPWFHTGLWSFSFFPPWWDCSGDFSTCVVIAFLFFGLGEFGSNWGHCGCVCI